MKTRTEILKKLKAEVAAGNVLLGAGAGTGISAKSAEAKRRGSHYHL